MGQGVEGRKVFFLVNPQAGGGQARRWWEQTRGQLEEAGLQYDWAYTDAEAAIDRQARRAVLEQGARAIIAVGGDGTLYEVINGLVEEDRLIAEDILFAAYPAGSACDFVRQAYNGPPPAIIELLQKGRIVHIDLGRCEYHDGQGQERLSYYLNSFDAGAGADTCVGINAGQGRIKKLLRSGPLAFKLTAFSVLLNFQYTDAEVIADGYSYQGRYIIIGAGNGGYSGGGMQMCPAARLDDGLLDLFMAEQRSFPAILRAFGRLYDGSAAQVEKSLSLQAREIVITTARPIAIEMDGEVPGFTPARLSVLPGLLPLLTNEA